MHIDLEANLTVNGKPLEMETAKKEEWEEEREYDELIQTSWPSRLFYDDDRKIDSIPKDLDQSIFFQLSWENVDNTSVEVSCNKDCAAIVVVWEHNDREDNVIDILTGQNWILRSEQQASWVNGYYTKVKGKSNAVLSKKIDVGTTLSFNRPANDLPISVFVIQG